MYVTNSYEWGKLCNKIKKQTDWCMWTLKSNSAAHVKFEDYAIDNTTVTMKYTDHKQIIINVMMMQHLYNGMLVHYTVDPREPQNGQNLGTRHTQSSYKMIHNSKCVASLPLH